MTIKGLVNDCVSKGIKLKDARNLVAEEIIIKKIASSDLVERVTFKGGIIMYSVSKSDRRVTQDLDFDLIGYSIEKESIELFIRQLNKTNDGFNVYIVGDIEELHQQNYKGVRVNTIIKDLEGQKLRLKLDIGVHTHKAIEQDRIAFCFGTTGGSLSIKVNPLEQVFAEKMLSLARLGVISTRYKDIYDFYYLIKECSISPEKVDEILLLFISKSNKAPFNISDLKKRITKTLNDKAFIERVQASESGWLNISYDDMKKTILDFVELLFD